MRGLRLLKPAVERTLSPYEMTSVEYGLAFFIEYLDDCAKEGIKLSESELRHRPGCEAVLEKLKDVMP